MPFDDQKHTRRDVLRSGGAALGTGALTFSAGCSGLPPLGSAIRYGTVDVPAAGRPAYRDWIPAPSALPGSEGSDGNDPSENSEDVMVYAPPPADAPAWTRANIARTLIAVRADYVGVDIDDVDVAFATGFGDESGGAVLLGDVDQSVVRETVGQTPYEPAESDTHHALYTRSDGGRSVAVFENGLVFADGPHARETIDTVVAAGRGEVPRLHERDDDFAVLTDSAGLRRWAWLWPGGISHVTGGGIREDTVGWATSFAHESDAAYLVLTWVFPESYDLTAGKVKTALKAESRAGLPGASEATAVDVSVDGRVATIEMQAPPSEFASASETALVTPFVTWSASHDPAAERLTIRHEAGDPVRTDWLWIAGLSEDRQSVDTQGLGDHVEPGESLTVSTTAAQHDETVRLVYEHPDEDGSTTLFGHDLT